MTLEEQVSLLSGADFWTTVPVERLDVPKIKVTDGPNGARGAGSLVGGVKATCFPVAIALGATWNPDLVERMPFGVHQLERVGHLVGADLVGACQRADDLLQLLVISDQRFVIDAEPGEAGGRGERIEVALETSGTDIEAARQRGCLGLYCNARNDKSWNGSRRQQGAKRNHG